MKASDIEVGGEYAWGSRYSSRRVKVIEKGVEVDAYRGYRLVKRNTGIRVEVLEGHDQGEQWLAQDGKRFLMTWDEREAQIEDDRKVKAEWAEQRKATREANEVVALKLEALGLVWERDRIYRGDFSIDRDVAAEYERIKATATDGDDFSVEYAAMRAQQGNGEYSATDKVTIKTEALLRLLEGGGI